jgi:hypothetical protein
MPLAFKQQVFCILTVLVNMFQNILLDVNVISAWLLFRYFMLVFRFCEVAINALDNQCFGMSNDHYIQPYYIQILSEYFLNKVRVTAHI